MRNQVKVMRDVPELFSLPRPSKRRRAADDLGVDHVFDLAQPHTVPKKKRVEKKNASIGNRNMKTNSRISLSLSLTQITSSHLEGR